VFGGYRTNAGARPARYAAVYGAAASVIVALLLFYCAAYIILLGAVLNAQLIKMAEEGAAPAEL
jgi:uncharacterized BrkB/YihY/UPF0761 family membrane protein